MTEYDYSPGAYERYVAKQNAIARWVDNTNSHPLANPFLPSEEPSSSYPKQTRGLTPRNDIDTGYEQESFPPSSRRGQRRDSKDRYHRPHYDRYDSHQSYRSHRSKHSRSSSSPPTPAPSTYPSQPPLNRGQSYQQRPGYNQQQSYYDSRHVSSSATPPLSPVAYTPYEQSSSNQPRLIAINGGSGGYVLMPPNGVSYRVVQSPPPDQEQPWYKRMFSPTSSASGKNKQPKSSVSRSSSGKRSGKWSLDIY